MNTPDLVSMDIFFNQLLSIFDSSVFPLINNTCWLMCYILPNSNVHIFRTWQYIVTVHSVWHWTDNLHSFGVINLSAATLVKLEDSDSSVKRSSDKLSACWREVNISDSTDMILVNCFGFVHFSQIEAVTVGVIITDSKIEWFERIKRHTRTLVRESDFLYRRLCP